MFKSLNNYKCIEMEDLPQEFLVEDSSVIVDFFDVRTGEITAGAYFVSIAEIVSDCQQTGTGPLWISKNYILGSLRETSAFFYLTLIKDKIGRMPAIGTAVC